MNATEVLKAHTWLATQSTCTCGWGYGDMSEDLDHVQHQLDSLRAAGFAIVELPRPNQYDEWSADERGASAPWFVWLASKDIQTRTNGNASPARARAYAAALLAAADAAEAQS